MTETGKPAWYRRPGVLAAIGVLLLAAGVGVGLWLSSEDDDGTQVDTTDTTVAPTVPPTTTAPPPTTVVTTTTVSFADQCAAGDQVACDQLDDDQLDAFCDEGNVDACQVLLARQGDGVPDGPDGEGASGGDGG
jgi:hypothetical protein